MDELIQRITSATGIDADTARSSLGTILKFLDGEDQNDTMSKLIHSIPGAADLIAEQGESGGIGGMLGGLMSSVGGSTGGALAALAQLKANGVGLGQAQGIATELLGFAREKAGDETVDKVLDSVPALKSFLG